MLNQEQKWLLMTTIGVPWTEFDKVSEEDEKFLLEKANEIKAAMEKQARETNANANPQLRSPNYS